MPISVVYPNLYLIFPEGRWILVTHGHLFELAWVFITEVFGSLMMWMSGDPPRGGLKWLEECNTPVNNLICTALGQGGPSSRVIRHIQAEAKQGKVREINRVLGAFLEWLDQQLEYRFPLEQLQDLSFKAAKRVISGWLKKLTPARGSTTFLEDRKKLIEKFLDATRLTMGTLKRQVVPSYLKEYPECVVFGHTHIPIFPQEPQLFRVADSPGAGGKIEFLNTGSCLRGETSAMISIDAKGDCSSWRVDFAPRKA